MELTQEFIDGLQVNEVKIMQRIAEELKIRLQQVSATVGLLNEGCTVPFISRYRKEATGTLDEVQVRDVSHLLASHKGLEERRLEVIRGIHSQGKLTEELYATIGKCATLAELEDLYAPYKKKKKTRGMIAQEKGLEPLAELMAGGASDKELEAEAAKYVKAEGHPDLAEHPELAVPSAQEALAGAMDILAERFSQDPENRAGLKNFYMKSADVVVKGVGDEEKAKTSVYKMYWDYREPLATFKPHRVLAINRGEREGQLEVRIEADPETGTKLLSSGIRFANSYHARAVEDGVIRLLSPAVIRELRSDGSEAADGHGIDVFSENLKNLLMQPPIKGTRVLGVDPGIRTGTKCAAIDETGKFLSYFVIRQDKAEESKAAIFQAIKKHELKLVAVGNGTGSTEVQKVVADLIAEKALDVAYAVVDEDGASVYSASDVAREEFPELDLTIRGAISIGRRLQDPLAELVKIEPKSIGVGLYQHDVNQKRLAESLDEVVGSVVNNVGVNLNTASHSLLKYVSGINSSLAKKIVKYRDDNGKILSREQLLKVPGMGPKSFEQCAGFLKILESENPLDKTWVHPENYPLAGEILPVAKEGRDLPRELRAQLKEKYSVGDLTIDDVVNELKKPSRDPREGLPPPILQKGVVTFEDLHEGMTVKGKVKNVVDFGAFVDIGIKESALLHVSEMSDGFVKDPMEHLKVGDVRDFRIISLDVDRRRIGVSLRSPGAERRGGGQDGPQGAAPGARPVAKVVARRDGGSPRRDDSRRDDGGKYDRPQGGRGPAGGQKSGGDDDGARRDRADDGARRDRADDGMTYNPFAELLKNKKK